MTVRIQAGAGAVSIWCSRQAYPPPDTCLVSACFLLISWPIDTSDTRNTLGAPDIEDTPDIQLWAAAYPVWQCSTKASNLIATGLSERTPGSILTADRNLLQGGYHTRMTHDG